MVKVFKLFVYLIESGKLFHIEEPIQEIVFYPHVSFAKRIFKLEKVIPCAHSTTWRKLNYFIQIIRINVTAKIAGYSISALINSFTGR